jgi:DNA-binding transcriptional LysR family regulator
MTQPTTTPEVITTPEAPAAGLPPIPPEVREFAEKVGAAPYLPDVLAMTRRLYPEGDLSVILIEDPEIEDYLHVGFHVDVRDWAAEQMLDLWNRWSSEIIRHCPMTHTPYFLLRL